MIKTELVAVRIPGMSYEVLARKLRPMGFDALVGQDHVVRALRHALDAGRLHHAYLFTGTRGVGKTTIARIVAKALNCEKGVSADPCGECSICLEVKQNRFVDLIEVDAASRTGVDDTRELLDNAQYLPTRGRYKVYLIDEVHMLSTASFNALLKTLEEPPEHVKFLLATTDPKKVPVTVLSRCLQFQLKNLSREAITQYLQGVLSSEDVAFEADALDIIARSAAGSMRDALSLTDQAIAYGQGSMTTRDVSDMLGVVGRDAVAQLLAGIAAGEAAQIMALSRDLAERSVDFADVLKGLLEALHDLAVRGAIEGPAASAPFSPEELQLYYQIALLGSRDLVYAPDERSGFEMTLLRMLAFAPEPASNVPPRSAPGESVSSTTAPDASAGDVRADGVANAPVAMDMPPSPKPDMLFSVPWYELVEQLAISGVTRMIAEHTVVHSVNLPDVELILDEGHDTLLSTGQTESLGRALAQALGQPVSLSIVPGVVRQETPAQRRARIADEKQIHAEAVIKQDANVQNLLAEFDGRVDQIRPV
ncbi:MAG: DNA polymerase III subunit gamma/tau [bacterium]